MTELNKKAPEKLYGIAVAAIPTSDGMTVFCTPIAVPKGNRQHFEIIEKLKFDIKWDDQKGMQACFAKIVDTLDEMVKRQQKSCADASVEYRPVCLYVGDDAANKLPFDSIDMIYNVVFRRPFQIVKSPSSIFPDNELLEQDHWRSWVKRDSEQEANFQQACHKLPKLLDQCIWKEGHFTGGDKRLHVDTMQQSDLDKELIPLKDKIDRGEDSDQSAHRSIIEKAETQGRFWASEVKTSPYTFATYLPEGYRKKLPNGEYEVSGDAKRRFPSYYFYDWHPDYKKAFYDGFTAEYGELATKGLYRYFKLPMDVPNPPFTDPCADKIVEQFQIIDGIRKKESVEEHPKLREELATLALNAAQHKWQNALNMQEAGELLSAAKKRILDPLQLSAEASFARYKPGSGLYKNAIAIYADQDNAKYKGVILGEHVQSEGNLYATHFIVPPDCNVSGMIKTEDGVFGTQRIPYPAHHASKHTSIDTLIEEALLAASEAGDDKTQYLIPPSVVSQLMKMRMEIKDKERGQVTSAPRPL